MTIRYRVITSERKVFAENMSKNEAHDILAQLQYQHPEWTIDIETYNWAPEGNRLGRDPDLH